MLFQLTIEATVGQTGYSDIAIDDVYIDSGLCSEYMHGNLKPFPIVFLDYFFIFNIKKIFVDIKDVISRVKLQQPPSDDRFLSNSLLYSQLFSISIKTECQDKYVSCAKWEREGQCKKNAKWMTDHCRRACSVCRKLSKSTNTQHA